MGELLDRKYQHEILSALATRYPAKAGVQSCVNEDGNRYVVNLAYLEEHGLVEILWSRSMKGETPLSAKITARGLDFLADDGGLGAILGVVTVKLHEDTLKQLLIGKVTASDADPTVKARLIDQIKSLPANVTTEVTMSAVRAGLERIPNVVEWLQALLRP